MDNETNISPGGDSMSEQTIESVRKALDLPSEVPVDLEGLRTVYDAWCRSMTFDNIRKVISLRSGSQRLAGLPAEDYFQNWLVNRSGGTCWPSSNALYELLVSYGFEARRVAGAMYDLPDPNHGTVKVRLDGIDHLVDSSMLTLEPLPLDGKMHIRTEGPVRVEVEPHTDGYLIWTDFPPMPEFIPCRLKIDPVDTTFYNERYEGSRAASPFNERLYLRRIRPDGLNVFLGNTLFRRTGEDLEVTEMTAEQLCTALHEIGGVSEALISSWVDVGGLDVTMNPTAPRPDFPQPGPRPSRR